MVTKACADSSGISWTTSHRPFRMSSLVKNVSQTLLVFGSRMNANKQ